MPLLIARIYDYVRVRRTRLQQAAPSGRHGCLAAVASPADACKCLQVSSRRQRTRRRNAQVPNQTHPPPQTDWSWPRAEPDANAAAAARNPMSRRVVRPLLAHLRVPPRALVSNRPTRCIARVARGQKSHHAGANSRARAFNLGKQSTQARRSSSCNPDQAGHAGPALAHLTPTARRSCGAVRHAPHLRATESTARRTEGRTHVVAGLITQRLHLSMRVQHNYKAIKYKLQTKILSLVRPSIRDPN
jgi:hypothetical protein